MTRHNSAMSDRSRLLVIVGPLLPKDPRIREVASEMSRSRNPGEFLAQHQNRPLHFSWKRSPPPTGAHCVSVLAWSASTASRSHSVVRSIQCIFRLVSSDRLANRRHASALRCKSPETSDIVGGWRMRQQDNPCEGYKFKSGHYHFSKPAARHGNWPVLPVMARSGLKSVKDVGDLCLLSTFILWS